MSFGFGIAKDSFSQTQENTSLTLCGPMVCRCPDLSRDFVCAQRIVSRSFTVTTSSLESGLGRVHVHQK